jgi:hypothetical protein
MHDADEEGTLAHLKADSPRRNRSQKRPNIGAASSRRLETACWSSFAGIVDAPRCATEMQAAMTERIAGAT